MNHRYRAFAAAVALLGVTACTDNNPDTASGTDGTDGTAGGAPVAVSSTATECTLSATEAPSGNLVFEVTNDGDDVTEFYLLASDGLRIVGEVENIGPGLTRKLVVLAQPGDYITACKPGMVGEGIRADFTVTDSGNEVGPTGERAELLSVATTQYAAYVKDQAEQLLVKTREFADLYRNGDDDAARALYANARMHWERIEPVAESFGDLDPRLDLREADLEDGQEWTGWHTIEKDLWPPTDGSYTALSTQRRNELADQLVADTEELVERVGGLSFTADQLGNGAKELLDEVATGKVTGEEEAWSHTDLWDFQANVDGARIAFEDLRPALDTTDAELGTTLEKRFTELQSLLDQYKTTDGWKYYNELTEAEVKGLSDAVNALSEPLSELTAAVVL